MRIIPETALKVDPKRPSFEAGKICDIKKDIAEDLISRGLAALPPVAVEVADESEADEASGD